MSNREYHKISREEFEDAIGISSGKLVAGMAFFTAAGTRSRELAYDSFIPDGNGLRIRIYSSVIPGAGARDVGEDAIRVCVLFDRKDGSTRAVGKDRRVNRIKTWKKNLLSRIEKVAAEKLVFCPDCGSPMKLRRGKFGEFYGCAEFPACKGTRKPQI